MMKYLYPNDKKLCNYIIAMYVSIALSLLFLRVVTL